MIEIVKTYHPVTLLLGRVIVMLICMVLRIRCWRRRRRGAAAYKNGRGRHRMYIASALSGKRNCEGQFQPRNSADRVSIFYTCYSEATPPHLSFGQSARRIGEHLWKLVSSGIRGVFDGETELRRILLY